MFSCWHVLHWSESKELSILIVHQSWLSKLAESKFKLKPEQARLAMIVPRFTLLTPCINYTLSTEVKVYYKVFFVTLDSLCYLDMRKRPVLKAVLVELQQSCCCGIHFFWILQREKKENENISTLTFPLIICELHCTMKISQSIAARQC